MRSTAFSLSLGVLLSACGGDPPDDTEPDAFVYPQDIYTGYDGSSTFRVPAVFTGMADVTWSLEDPSLASIDADGSVVTLTSRAAGTTTLIATSPGRVQYKASLYVSLYQATSAPRGEMLYGPADRNCVECHTADGGVDHTPSEIGALHDAFLLVMVNEGRNRHGEYFDYHKFDLIGADQEAVVAYIRSLPPRGVPDPASDGLPASQQ